MSEKLKSQNEEKIKLTNKMPVHEVAGKRQCFSPPIPEIFEAARLLDQAVAAHLRGDIEAADRYLRDSDIQAIGDWLDPIWLRKSALVKAMNVEGLPPVLPKEQRYKPRLASRALCKALVERDGHHCRFCGMPLVRPEVRKLLNKLYPDAARWTSAKETDQHRGLQAMWMQYDHILVHSRGGATDMDNIVVTCAACNFGRDRFTLEEMGLTDPRTDIRLPTWEGRLKWNGLESLLPEPERFIQAPSSFLRPV
jgi:hypothetical protein